ncbi:glycoside hydrolase family 16 protein [Peniophora sp. CONT]|nr:glycoside hydrolase family 16 protein [Peniophora sp. CONT]
MVFISTSLVLASLAASALAGRGDLRARHEKLNRALHERSSLALKANYTGSDFMDTSKWNYFTGQDPTNGKVDYLSLTNAKKAGLVKSSGDKFIMSVETGDLPSGTDRKSVRISSVQQWSSGLIIADFEQMPHGCGTCDTEGVWPAFWTVGANWPEDGEIDIIEGVNTRTNNQLTLHSGGQANCTIDTNPPLVNGVSGYLANVLNTQCLSTADSDAGCSFSDPDPNSFGPGFNAVGGRVMAILRDDTGVKMWSFARDDVPADILGGAPNPYLWSSPRAFWSSATCDIKANFAPQTIVLNTDVGGGWTEGDLASSGCGSDIASVVADGSNFNNGNWTVNYIALFD